MIQRSLRMEVAAFFRYKRGDASFVHNHASHLFPEFSIISKSGNGVTVTCNTFLCKHGHIQLAVLLCRGFILGSAVRKFYIIHIMLGEQIHCILSIQLEIRKVYHAWLENSSRPGKKVLFIFQKVILFHVISKQAAQNTLNTDFSKNLQ